jgi:hypothetical protein
LQAVLALVGAFFIAYKIPSQMADDYQLATWWRISFQVFMFAVLAILFFVVWCKRTIIDFVTDSPLPGFDQQTASALASIAEKALPALPRRKRSRIVMAVGLAAKTRILEHAADQLSYFAEQRFKTLAREIGRESDFSEQAIKGLVDRTSFLIENLEFFIQTSNPWLSMAYIQNSADDPQKALEECAGSLRKIKEEMSNSAAEFRQPDGNKSEKELRDNREQLRTRLQADFKEFHDRILEIGTKIADLGAKVKKENERSADLVVILTEWSHRLP